MGKNPVRQCRPHQLSDMVENSRFIQPHISVPDGARPFGGVTPPLENDRDTFVPHQGISQMVTNLLPSFLHLVIKCGERGVVIVMRASRKAGWASERSNIHGRYIVSSEGGNDTSPCWSIPPRVIPRMDRQPGGRGHARCVHTRVIGSGPEGI